MQEAEKYIKDKITAELSSIGVSPTTAELSKLVSKYAIEYRYYIESYNKLKVNYQPNAEVMAFMKQNKDYIVQKARERLSESARQSIETSIKMFEEEAGEAYESVVSGVTSSVEVLNGLRTGLLE